MKNKMNQLFKDKLVLVMTVLGLLTIVAAAGAVNIRREDPAKQPQKLEIPETQGILAKETPDEQEEKTQEETRAKAAGSSNASRAEQNGNRGGDENEPAARKTGTGPEQSALLYDGTEKLGWPVQGNVILDYSMETTTYFPTLEQYKCNPALIIQGEISAPVVAPARARVLEVGANEEIGNFVVLDFGGQYTAICGQLKDIQVAENQVVEKRDTLGYVAEPTKYYSIEGDNLYFELQHGEKPVDALDYLE
ncbi:MAG: peptidoglycan DD-metalloendopeptidase family protein [Clostridium sp.]